MNQAARAKKARTGMSTTVDVTPVLAHSKVKIYLKKIRITTIIS